MPPLDHGWGVLGRGGWRGLRGVIRVHRVFDHRHMTKGSPSGADPFLRIKGVGALALVGARVGDFLWISFETGNPSGTDPATKIKGLA